MGGEWARGCERFPKEKKWKGESGRQKNRESEVIWEKGGKRRIYR